MLRQGGTYCGNPLMAAVGLAVVGTVCDETFLRNVRAKAERLAGGLRAVVRDHALVGERGVGLLRALMLPGEHAGRVVEVARELEPHGLLLNAPRPHLLRLMPALTIEDDEIDEALALLRQALTRASYAASEAASPGPVPGSGRPMLGACPRKFSSHQPQSSGTSEKGEG